MVSPLPSILAVVALVPAFLASRLRPPAPCVGAGRLIDVVHLAVVHHRCLAWFFVHTPTGLLIPRRELPCGSVLFLPFLTIHCRRFCLVYELFLPGAASAPVACRSFTDRLVRLSASSSAVIGLSWTAPRSLPPFTCSRPPFIAVFSGPLTLLRCLVFSLVSTSLVPSGFHCRLNPCLAAQPALCVRPPDARPAVPLFAAASPAVRGAVPCSCCARGGTCSNTCSAANEAAQIATWPPEAACRGLRWAWRADRAASVTKRESVESRERLLASFALALHHLLTRVREWPARRAAPSTALGAPAGIGCSGLAVSLAWRRAPDELALLCGQFRSCPPSRSCGVCCRPLRSRRTCLASLTGCRRTQQVAPGPRRLGGGVSVADPLGFRSPAWRCGRPGALCPGRRRKVRGWQAYAHRRRRPGLPSPPAWRDQPPGVILLCRSHLLAG